MQNLKQYYFANAESVIAQRAGYLVEQYLLTAAAQVNLTDGCGVINEINKDCFVGTANTPTGALFQEWRQKRFEDKLLTNYGIELRTEPNNRKFLRINGIDAIDYGTASFEDIRLNKDNYKRVVKDAVAYKRVNGALEKETFYKRVYYRYKVGRLLETKFGLNPCVVACNTRKVIKAKKQLAQLTVVNRVVTPRFQFLGLVMGCIIDTSSSSGCNTDPDFGGGDGQPGDRRSALEGELARYAYLSGINVTDEALDKAAGILDDINRRGGFVEYFIGGVAEKIAGEAGEKVALKSIPIVGWVSTAVDLIAQTAKIGTFLRYANYADHAVAAVQMYGTWQSYADELKRGYGDSATNASMAGALSNGIDADAPSSESAEDAPMWAEINGNTSPSTAFNFLIPSVFAEGESEENGATYTCDDGTTADSLESNNRICPEESFQIQNEALGAFASTFDQEPQKTIGDVAREVQTALGLFGNAVDGITSAVIENIPFIDSITATLTAQLEPVITALTKSITKYLIPSAVNTSMSGARLFQVLAAGANVSATDSNQLALGAPKVSDQAAARYRQQYLDEVRAEFATKPLSQRLFAKSDTNSLLNRVALASPGSTGNVANSTVATMLSSPFQTISTSFASLFSQPRAFAADPTDPWGIPQAAYDPNDPLLQVDPATYTKEYCAQVTQTWKDSFTLDPVSGQEVATVANPCLLEEAVTQSLGGFNNSALLPADSLAAAAPEAAAPAIITPTPTPGTASLTPIDISQTSLIPGAGNYRLATSVLPQFMAMVAAAKAQGVDLYPISSGWRDPAKQIALRKANCPDWQNSPSSACSPPTAKPGNSQHEKGNAVDFGSMCFARGVVPSCPGNARWEWLRANAAQFGFKQLPSESWHWSTTGR